MKYEYFNPVDERGSCITRTMAKLLDKDFYVAKEELITLSKELGYDDYREIEVFEEYLENHNYKKTTNKGLVKDLELNEGKYAVFCNKDDFYHMFPVIDGVIYDKSLKYLDMNVLCLYKYSE